MTKVTKTQTRTYPKEIIDKFGENLVDNQLKNNYNIITTKRLNGGIL